jgi:hypothetical protein
MYQICGSTPYKDGVAGVKGAFGQHIFSTVEQTSNNQHSTLNIQ